MQIHKILKDSLSLLGLAIFQRIMPIFATIAEKGQNPSKQLSHYGWTRRREIWRLLSILGRTLPPTKLCHNSDKDSKVHTKFEIIQGWVEIQSSRVLFVRNLLKTGSNWTGTKTYFVKLNQVFIERIKTEQYLQTNKPQCFFFH